MPEFPFTGTPGFKVEIPDDSDKLYFSKLFVDEEIIPSLTLQTNKYAADFIQANAQKPGEHSRFSKSPKDGIKSNKMLAFIALTYYMGIVKKDLTLFPPRGGDKITPPSPPKLFKVSQKQFEILA